ncbi:MAG: sensor histidine kinase [Lachnospiraceae bacterium]|nr:sensor histidine kinase [Lachnospiraceae bacterium]
MKGIIRKLKWKNLKLRGQMYLVYFLALIIPLSVIGTVLVYNAEKMFSSYYMEMLKTENTRVKNLLSQVTIQAYNISNEICLDRDQKSILSADYEAGVDFVKRVNTAGKIDDIVYNNTQISGIYIYTDNPTINNYKQYNKVTPDIESQDWYKRAMSETSAFWTEINGESLFAHKNNTICLVRRILLPDSEYRAVLIIRLGDAYIRSHVDSGLVDVMSLDEGGVVYSTYVDWYGQDMVVDIDYDDSYYNKSTITEIDDIMYYATLSTTNLHMTDSRLYICTMNGNCYYDIERVRNMLVFILTLAVLIPGIILIVFTQRFTNRVYLLRQEMHKASMKDYDMATKFPGHDELAEAFDDLKKMVDDIKYTQAKIYEAELNEKELRNNQQIMEYKMLASQINPHYLYNTLETIRMKSLTMGNKEVADCIKILGKTLQYVLKNTGTTSTTLGKEIEHMENYLTIQKMRFGNRINYNISVDETLDVESYYVLPLMLQPLVENAVVHGLENIESEGWIDIDIFKNNEEQLQITVKDSGLGMEPEELEKLKEKLNTPNLKLESSIGVYNISERIRLHYGESYGLRLESEYKKGTTVTLYLPIITARF